MSLSDYHATAGDWREQLRKNERKTRFVIALFIGVYAAVGLVADVFILQSFYPGRTFDVYFNALVTFKVVPYATLIMIAIALISLMVTYSLYDRIMLLGTEYHEVTPESFQNLQ